MGYNFFFQSGNVYDPLNSCCLAYINENEIKWKKCVILFWAVLKWGISNYYEASIRNLYREFPINQSDRLGRAAFHTHVVEVTGKKKGNPHVLYRKNTEMKNIRMRQILPHQCRCLFKFIVLPDVTRNLYPAITPETTFFLRFLN